MRTAGTVIVAICMVMWWRMPKLMTRPHIELLREDNARQGFFEHEQYEAVLKHLGEELRPVVTFAYITGWRIKSEVLTLEW